MDIKPSMDRCAEYASTLPATDPRFNQAAQVLHEDGSLFKIQNAFVMTDPENPDCLWLITEHFGEMVFHIDDVERWDQDPDFTRLPNYHD